MTEDYNSGKWIGWNGGECPVHPKSVVDVFFADGHRGSSESEAKILRWSRISSCGDIVAFRVVKEYREPRECWSVGKHMHDSLADAESFRARVDAANPGHGHLDMPIRHWREVVD